MVQGSWAVLGAGFWRLRAEQVRDYSGKANPKGPKDPIIRYSGFGE